MSTQIIYIDFQASPDEPRELTQSRIGDCLRENAEACSDAAAIWARLHYGHAAYTDGTLAVESVEFSSNQTGKATMIFDWTFQDGCSDICREGTGYVEVSFSASNNQLELSWDWPERPSTADEF